MKHILLAVVTVWSGMVLGCDVCGGVSANSTVGLFASSRFHLFGIKSEYRSYHSYIDGIRHSREYIFSPQLTGRVQLHRRLQLFATIPYQFSLQKRSLGSDFQSGWGDPTLVLNSIVIDRKDSLRVTKHFLSLGTGVKTPFGTHTRPDDDLKNLYPGTGAWNFLLISNYTWNISEKWSWQNEGSYAFKGKDNYGFAYGNSLLLSSSAILGKKFRGKRGLISIGGSYENYSPAKWDQLDLLSSDNSGWIISTKMGVHVIASKWLISVNAIQPILQDYNAGAVKRKMGGDIQINYLIQQKKK